MSSTPFWTAAGCLFPGVTSGPPIQSTLSLPLDFSATSLMNWGMADTVTAVFGS